MVYASISSTIAWHENLGGGIFGPQNDINLFNQASYSVFVADLDEDGDKDVLAPSRYDSSVSWYENQGTGSFSSQQVISSSNDWPLSVYAEDLDGDGDADVMATDYSDGLVFWFENQGSGSFGPKQVIASVGTPFAVHAADLDGDGDADVLSAAYGGGIAWYENQGGGVFGTAQILAGSGTEALFVNTADLDGDGDLEVIGGCVGKVVWFDNFTIDPDCNGNGVPDVADISAGTSLDCNANGIPDECDFASGAEFDCNANGTPDSCDIASGSADCDADGIPDACQIAADNSLDLNANGVLDRCEAIGTNYCSPAISNSTGAPAEIIAFGSELLFFSNVTLAARGLPQNTFAMFFTSQVQGYAIPIPGSQGALCILGQTGRYNRPGQIMSSGSSGSLMFPIDVLSIPTSTGFTSAQSGETWNFQAWYRDANPTVTSNFTDAVGITFQ